MSMWLMYLIIILDDLQQTVNICGVIILILAILFFVIAAFMAMSNDSDEYIKQKKYCLKNSYRLIIASVILSLGMVLIPTTKQAAAIYFVPKVINNKQVCKMPDKLVTLANDWMDEQIKSIKSK